MTASIETSAGLVL